MSKVDEMLLGGDEPLDWPGEPAAADPDGVAAEPDPTP